MAQRLSLEYGTLRRGLQHISELTNLEDVDLSDTAITDQGMLSFAPLKRLQRLNLSYTGAAHHNLHKHQEPALPFLGWQSDLLAYMHV